MTAGIVVAVLSTQVLATFLFDVEPTDPATFAGSIGLFLVAAAAACLIPALRALRVDPSTVLRHE